MVATDRRAAGLFESAMVNSRLHAREKLGIHACMLMNHATRYSFLVVVLNCRMTVDDQVVDSWLEARADKTDPSLVRGPFSHRLAAMRRSKK